MSSYVFYCKNCEKTFAGDDYQASDTPCCPSCFKNTLSTGVTKEVWIEKTKEERKKLLERLVKEDAQIRQNAARQAAHAQAVVATYKEEDHGEGSALDGLYVDIGKKIKNWAKWIFIVEAIACIISAIGMCIAAEESWMVFAGVLTMVIGPLVAWVSSWILYAFGELVDKTVANEENTRYMLKLMQEKNGKKDKS